MLIKSSACIAPSSVRRGLSGRHLHPFGRRCSHGQCDEYVSHPAFLFGEVLAFPSYIFLVVSEANTSRALASCGAEAVAIMFRHGENERNASGALPRIVRRGHALGQGPKIVRAKKGVCSCDERKVNRVRTTLPDPQLFLPVVCRAAVADAAFLPNGMRSDGPLQFL